MVVNGRARHVTEDLVQTLDQIVRRGDLFVSRSLEEARDIVANENGPSPNQR